MKRFLPFLALLLCSIPGMGAITFVDANSCTSGTTTCTLTISTTAGNTAIIYGITNTTGTTFTVSDSGGDSDTFTRVGANPGFCEASGNNCVTAFVVNWKATNAVEPVVVTCSASTNFMGGMYIQFSGFSNNGALDKNATASYTAATSLVTGTTATTATANEALVGMFGEASTACGTFTQTGGYTVAKGQTLGSPNSNFEIEYLIVAATGTYQATATSGSACTGGGWIITLQAASAGVKRLRGAVVNQ